MNQAKHNKLRNTGLLFEFLIRQITIDVVNKSNNSKATKLVKKFFNENTQLGKEFALYNAILNKKFVDDKKASYFVDQVITNRANLNLTELRREKYNLIKEIKESYNLVDFLSTRIDNYKIYASVYNLFEHNLSLSPDKKTIIYFKGSSWSPKRSLGVIHVGGDVVRVPFDYKIFEGTVMAMTAPHAVMSVMLR